MPPGVWLAAVWVLVCLTEDASPALTTFGKTNQQQPPPPPKPTPRPAKECTKESDCAGIKDTSCVKHPYDLKMRCLCGDNESPVNGNCDAKLKGLRHPCTDNKDCMDGMMCAMPNATKSSGNSNNSPQVKRCLCNQEDGYVDKEFFCSFSAINLPNNALILMAVGAFSIIFKRVKLYYDN